MTIPELGTITATTRPHVVLTSNRTREIGDALRRRCLYLFVGHPTLEKEVRIIRSRVPAVSERLGREVAGFVQALRRRPLAKAPGAAETIDWAAALARLGGDRLDEETVRLTLGCLAQGSAGRRRASTERRSAGCSTRRPRRHRDRPPDPILPGAPGERRAGGPVGHDGRRRGAGAGGRGRPVRGAPRARGLAQDPAAAPGALRPALRRLVERDTPRASASSRGGRRIGHASGVPLRLPELVAHDVGRRGGSARTSRTATRRGTAPTGC